MGTPELPGSSMCPSLSELTAGKFPLSLHEHDFLFHVQREKRLALIPAIVKQKVWL